MKKYRRHKKCMFEEKEEACIPKAAEQTWGESMLELARAIELMKEALAEEGMRL